jgi:uncharacterized protein involved in type VI secretion and phage assembly
VPQIVDAAFARWSGRLAPELRLDLADAAAYPQRSLCVQYQETDLAFVQRLLREEGLFYWWEHQARCCCAPQKFLAMAAACRHQSMTHFD